jgi:DNA-binding transcriptional regulator YdaS (Cro superfamily)
MYQLADGGIQTVLPKELAWDWSNAASGAMGYGDDRRPTGIRLTKAQCQVYGGQKAALRKIFSSEQTLTQFIQSSDRQGAVRVAAAKKKAARAQVIIANPPYKATAPSYNVSSVTVGPNKNEIVIKLVLVS